ncbi:50S ribosomal protein L28, chloroplastic [Canna indica]|uniref:Large ribosomal subunit protein bL28c n=1 Tax=Canna indica TaxID=4628 RepID=A0AAQ3JST5_9LILI|nr:50S ribosomal protein L28, chloroplastic [Canna indica]
MAVAMAGHSTLCFARTNHYSVTSPPLSSASKLRVSTAVSVPVSTSSMRVLGFGRSQLVGLPLINTAVVTSPPSLVRPTPRVLPVVARRVCPFTGKKANKANKVSFSNHKTKKLQFVNLQYKRVWWEAGKRYLKLRLSTKALKTIEKNGLDAVAKKAGIDLRKK